jgi:hypothetical protein
VKFIEAQKAFEMSESLSERNYIKGYREGIEFVLVLFEDMIKTDVEEKMFNDIDDKINEHLKDKFK